MENGKVKIPTFGCEGCKERKETFLAGEWQLDLLILVSVLALGFVLYRTRLS